MTMTLGALAEVVRAAAWPMIALRFRAVGFATFKGSVPDYCANGQIPVIVAGHARSPRESVG
jgi:hypothetical protein